MGLLIDVDALKSAFYEKCCEECGVCPEATTTDKTIGDCVCKQFASCGLIDAAPTIDAIPVAWLEAKRERMANAGQDTAEQAIAYVLWLWQKEQEASVDADGT